MSRDTYDMTETRKWQLTARGAICRPVGWTLQARRKVLRWRRKQRKGEWMKITAFMLLVSSFLFACGGHPGTDASLVWRGRNAQDELAMQEAIAEWNHVCGFHLSMSPDGETPVYYNQHLPQGVGAHTRTEGLVTDIQYNVPTREEFAHELEHLMGVHGHSTDPKALMFGGNDAQPYLDRQAHVKEEDCNRVRKANSP